MSEGWNSADDPPDNSTIPESSEKFWWTHPTPVPLPHGTVIAWREIEDDRWYENDPEY